MTKTISSLFVAAMLALGLNVAPAQALSSRTFVSAASGNDANACDSVATPCRTFQGAHDKTNSDGEITVLDPGGYGAVTITKSISVVNDGVGEAGVLVSGGLIGITINASPNDKVSLRGLTVKGIGFGGGTGIDFIVGKSLTIENCTVRNMTSEMGGGSGILYRPHGSSSFAVSNTVVADNDSNGIAVLGGGILVATLYRVQAYSNRGRGIYVQGGGSAGSTSVTVADSIVANNGIVGRAGGGLVVENLIRSPTNVTASGLVTAHNTIGILAGGPLATVRVGQSTVTGNVTSWLAGGGGVLLSYGDNNIDGNGDGDPAPPTIAKK